MSVQIVLNVGPELFRFDTHAQCVARAQDRFADACVEHGLVSARIVCIDQQGRICASGKELREADESGAFPVVAYAIDPMFAKRGGGAAA